MTSLLEYLVPILSILPEVEKPRRRQDGVDKVMWTAFSLFVFLLCSQIPVYGIRNTTGGDPFYWMRAILASNKGTLMELGISPIVTASLIMQFLRGAKLVHLSPENNARDRKIFAGAEKAFGLIITIVQATSYVMSGNYGDVKVLGTFTCVLIVTQLTVAGIIVLLLDEMLQKGYGFGSGVSLFVAVNICESIIWQAFSPLVLNGGRGPEYEGAVISMFYQLVQSSNKVKALKDAFYRPHLPNMLSLLSTSIIFGIAIYAQGFAVKIGLQHAPTRQPAPQKIKLFYTANMPIVLQAALVSNLYFISSILYTKFPKNSLVNFIGVWKAPESSPTSVMPVSGLVYYLTPPKGIVAVGNDPAHALGYVFFVMISCIFFSKAWTAISSQTGGDLATQWYQQQLIMPGRPRSKENLQALVDRYVPTAAALGGACIGALTILADLMGAVGSGTGILLAVTFIHSYYEQLDQERLLPRFLRS
eukprot:TRINITY_DN14820_c0_g1_i2.p1 TRINITY_DN14820_c0_g1~~TRINITY_DN14820_c0_g1_i2.p1  ORF type:complete len:475 (+),score=65.58 TRINITY_DN14820_c0_g1_i2:33-1457(+)